MDSATEFLCFSLGGLEYGLEFGKVRELRLLETLQRVDGMAVSRGVIMPIVDMRAAVEGAPAPADPAMDVIILQLDGGMMGVVVDGVTGVIKLREHQITRTPNADYLIGLGESDGRRLVLVDIDRLMAIKRKDPLAQMGSVAAIGGD